MNSIAKESKETGVTKLNEHIFLDAGLNLTGKKIENWIS